MLPHLHRRKDLRAYFIGHSAKCICWWTAGSLSSLTGKRMCTGWCFNLRYQLEFNCRILLKYFLISNSKHENLCLGRAGPLCSDQQLIWWCNLALEMDLLRVDISWAGFVTQCFLSEPVSVGSCYALSAHFKMPRPMACSGIRGEVWLSAETFHSLMPADVTVPLPAKPLTPDFSCLLSS